MQPWVPSALSQPTSCTIAYDSPVAASMTYAVEARNAYVGNDVENLNAMRVARRIVILRAAARARVVRQESLWGHARPPHKTPLATGSIWMLDHGHGFRQEQEASKPMYLYFVRFVDGELLGIEGWIAPVFCLG
jgi:hypothetical protein